jgi:hypothetical protein
MSAVATPTCGVMAEFIGITTLVEAIHAARERGYTSMDAFTPFPSEEVVDALHLRPSPLPALVLGGGVLGCLLGYGLQVYAMAYDYPLNVGGRPLHSWPYFVPITFEVTVLCASLAAVFGMLALCRLPTPYHPVFNVPGFAMASRDRFFLLVESSDPRFDRDALFELFNRMEARHVADVPL